MAATAANTEVSQSDFAALSAAARLSLIESAPLEDIAARVASLSDNGANWVNELTFRYERIAERLQGDSQQAQESASQDLVWGLQTGMRRDLIHKCLEGCPELDVYKLARRLASANSDGRQAVNSTERSPHIPPLERGDYRGLEVYSGAYEAALNRVRKYEDTSLEAQHSKAVSIAAHWIAEGSQALNSGRGWESPYNQTTGLTEAVRLGEQANKIVDSMRGSRNNAPGGLAKFIGKSGDYERPRGEPEDLSFTTDRVHEAQHMSPGLKYLKLHQRFDSSTGGPNWLTDAGVGTVKFLFKMLSEGVPVGEATGLAKVHHFRGNPKELLETLEYELAYGDILTAQKQLKFIERTGESIPTEGAAEKFAKRAISSTYSYSYRKDIKELTNSFSDNEQPFSDFKGAVRGQILQPNQQTVPDLELLRVAVTIDFAEQLEGRKFITEGDVYNRIREIALKNLDENRNDGELPNLSNMKLVRAVGLERDSSVIDIIKSAAQKPILEANLITRSERVSEDPQPLSFNVLESSGNSIEILQPYKDLPEVRESAARAFMNAADKLAGAGRHESRLPASAVTVLKRLERDFKLTPEDFKIFSDEERGEITEALLKRTLEFGIYEDSQLSFYTVRKTLNMIGCASEDIQDCAKQVIGEQLNDGIKAYHNVLNSDSARDIQRLMKYSHLLGVSGPDLNDTFMSVLGNENVDLHRRLKLLQQALIAGMPIATDVSSNSDSFMNLAHEIVASGLQIIPREGDSIFSPNEQARELAKKIVKDRLITLDDQPASREPQRAGK